MPDILDEPDYDWEEESSRLLPPDPDLNTKMKSLWGDLAQYITYSGAQSTANSYYYSTWSDSNNTYYNTAPANLMTTPAIAQAYTNLTQGDQMEQNG